MRRLTGKLKSEKGASILLAMLLLLICMMVGASVLMAAVSNAGKARSNRQEEQVYLALSSALRLVTDDLVSVKYTGSYQLLERSEPAPSTMKTRYFVPLQGEFNCLMGELAYREVFDALFQRYIARLVLEKNNNTDPNLQWALQDETNPDPDTIGAGIASKRTFLITADETGLPELKDFQIKMEIETPGLGTGGGIADDYRLIVTASVEKVSDDYYKNGYPSYAMQAELTVQGSEKPAFIENTEMLNPSAEVKPTTPLQLELSKIVRLEPEENGGGT